MLISKNLKKIWKLYKDGNWKNLSVAMKRRASPLHDGTASCSGVRPRSGFSDGRLPAVAAQRSSLASS